MRSFSTCGSHFYCYACLSAHLLSLITDAELHRIACPQPGCAATPLDSDIQDFVPPDIFDKYLRFTVLAVLDSENVRWCPRPECSQPCLMAETCDDRGECPHCLTMFCTKCSKIYHPETNCDGQLLDEGDRLFNSWMAEQGTLVKNCPSCNHSVEKNSGCNHMTCRCGAGWCWLCNEAYSSGTHFSEGHCRGFQFAEYNSLLEAQLVAFRNNGPGAAIAAEHNRQFNVRISEYRANLAEELHRRSDELVKAIRPTFLQVTFNQATQQSIKIFANDAFKEARRNIALEMDAELESRCAEESIRLREYFAAETERALALAQDNSLQEELQLIIAENERRRQLNLPLHSKEEDEARARIQEAERLKLRQIEEAAERERLQAEERNAAEQQAQDEARHRIASREARKARQAARQAQLQADREALRDRRPARRQRAEVLVRFGGAI